MKKQIAKLARMIKGLWQRIVPAREVNIEAEVEQLEAEVEALLDLTIRAYQRFIFLRPMMADQKLHDQINTEGKARGFNRLRLWLYWSLVQQLSNICSDKDKRSPSILRVTRKLKKDVHLRKQLEEKYCKNPHFGEAELRVEFNNLYLDYLGRADGMLSSQAVGGYKQIRNKLISHNELQQSKKSPTGYDFFDVKIAKVKYGDERILLETLQVLTKQLLLIVKNVDFGWDSALQQAEKVACEFWGT
jgi:hypothetical protein